LIIGFEGDASLPIGVRRRKDSPLRDLASLLNSLDYARVSALERAIVTRPEQRERLGPALDAWLASASNALTAGYKAGVGKARCLPSNETDVVRLLRLFRISRALHEADSELSTRIPWSGVPLEVLIQEIERS
jgi:maltose alpha-D-glucosyltransferase/alpha-amylase